MAFDFSWVACIGVAALVLHQGAIRKRPRNSQLLQSLMPNVEHARSQLQFGVRNSTASGPFSEEDVLSEQSTSALASQSTSNASFPMLDDIMTTDKSLQEMNETVIWSSEGVCIPSMMMQRGSQDPFNPEAMPLEVCMHGCSHVRARTRNM